MSRLLKPNEKLVCVGLTALRAPDGTPLQGVPMYVIVDECIVEPKTGLSYGEAGLFDDVVKNVLAPKFKEYMDGVKKRGNHHDGQ